MAGIKKILIPIKPEELTIEKIEPYFPTIMQQFICNSLKIAEDYNIYCLQHDILSKEVKHNDIDINNKVLQPHIAAMVDWKTGYVFGNPIKYTQTLDNQTDDIEYLNKYSRDCNRRTIDKEVAMWTYATGIGYYFIQPKGERVNTEYQAPYELYCREANTCTKIYSAYNGKKPLFDMLYTQVQEIDEQGVAQTVSIIDIYLPNHYYQYRAPYESWNTFTLAKDEVRSVYTELPLVEKRLNPNGIGIVAMAKAMQHALDLIVSNELDNIEEVNNVIYKYKGVNIGDSPEEQSANHKTIRKNGAVVIPYINGMPFEPNVEIEKTDAFNFSDINVLLDYIKRTMYETVGVPLGTSSTNSGGTTKSGSEVANGYDNAYNRALDDINYFLLADTELLAKMIFICERTANNKINDLHTSEIEIKYSLNLNDNMQIKTQSLGTCIGVGMPPAMALRICRLSNDPEAEGRMWEDYMAEKARKEQEQQAQISAQQSQNQTTVNVEENLDNN